MASNWVSEAARKRSLTNRGFSLIELLIVVAIILIIAAIAVPNFLQSKMRANEAATVGNLRNIGTAEVIYSTTYSIGFSPDLPSLGGTGTMSSSAAQLIDQVLASGTRSGYTFSYTVLATDPAGNPTSYGINADPVAQNLTGVRHFYMDQTAMIRVNNASTASSTDLPIQ